MHALRFTNAVRPTLRETLRSATAEHHGRLDALFDHMLEPRSDDLYRRFIRMNHACHSSIEPILATSAISGLAEVWAGGDRLDALARDLAGLGLPPIEMPAFEPGEPDFAEAVGISYVLEGSRLGGAALSRRLQRSGGNDAARTHNAYLRASERTGVFRSFVLAVEALDWSENDRGRAADTAVATFDFFLLATLRGGRPT